MLSPSDADRALCALKYSTDATTRSMAEFIVQRYLVQIAQPILAVAQAQNIANSGGEGPKAP